MQHAAEVLGALAVSQTARPGAPVIFGGGPSIMDMKKGTACQASTEAVIMGACTGQIAKRLHLPCAMNTGRAHSKCVDYQAGEESGIALTLMALAGLKKKRGDAMHTQGPQHESRESLMNIPPRAFDKDKEREIDRIMMDHAKKYGIEHLPVMEIA